MSEEKKDWGWEEEIEWPGSMIVQMASAENVFEDLLQATQEKMELLELHQAAKQGGIPIQPPSTPATAVKLTPAEIAKTIRVNTKELHRKLYEYHHKENLVLDALIAKTLVNPPTKETKEELNNRIKETQTSLETLKKDLANRYKAMGKALTEIQSLAQALPAIDNSPQGKAQNTLRAIVAILKSNGDI